MTQVPHKIAVDRYTTISGRIPNKYISQLNQYDISDPKSEVMLQYCIWDDYRKNEAYQNCVVKNSDYYLSQTKTHSLQELKDAVKNFCESSTRYYWHLNQMESNYENIKNNNISIDEKKAFALVLSYYTGFKENSDRTSSNTNAIIRGENSYEKTEKWSDGPEYYVVIYYITKAISNLPFYWGYTIRCIQLTDEQIQTYQPGTIVSWLNWSSSKIGTEPASYFKDRNTWFYLYSFSSREISQFSIYEESEKEALYPPFSHFLVFKKEYVNGKYRIYMRQIEIGLYVNNIVWVDDNILNANWENKTLMEMAYLKNKTLKIIPKITTDTAMAFLKSFKPFIKTGTIKYKIMSDMTRNNEYPSDNAGARLVKYLQDNGFGDIEIMIFTSSKEKALRELKKLNVVMNNKIKVTTMTSDAINFLITN